MLKQGNGRFKALNTSEELAVCTLAIGKTICGMDMACTATWASRTTMESGKKTSAMGSASKNTRMKKNMKVSGKKGSSKARAK